jgi:hypothetical protein
MTDPAGRPVGIEQRLRRALTDDTGTRPSTDLFDRVVGSIEDERARRRRRRRQLRRSLLRAVGVIAGVTALTTPFCSIDNGRLQMPWWLLEILTTGLLVTIALWLGPFIKRFGRAYAADVFHDNPRTGKSYIVLTDIVYYLIFSAYILFTVNFESQGWGPYVGAAQLKNETARIGGILLIIGILHGLNIVLMPVLGRLFSLNRRLPDRTA